MAKDELIVSITTLSNKIDKLILHQKRLYEKIEELEETNAELRNQHQLDNKELEKARKEIQFLSLSHRLADSPEALFQAKADVARLIRTIDNCIRLIMED